MEQMNLQITQTAQPTFTVEVVQNLIPVITAQVVIGAGSGGATVVFGDTMTGTGTPADPVNVSNDILDQIQNNASQIEEIQDLIPATANQNNPLVDQGFVNSSIQTATAYFRGDWATWADVPSDPALYPADATGNHTPITNDYMVVIADEQENGGTWRYKYTGLWSEQGKSGWMPEYQVNETPLTAAQLAALNSGITADAVASFVKNTDYPLSNKPGVVQQTPHFAFGASSQYPYAQEKSLAQYTSATGLMFVGKATLENIKYDLVKRAITTNDIVLTDAEKAAAQAWLGVSGGDFLPLSGGDMSGPIRFSGTAYSITYEASKLGLVIYTSSGRGFVFTNSGYGVFYPTTNGATDLGQANNMWRKVYATTVNNGADIAIPTTGGSMVVNTGLTDDSVVIGSVEYGAAREVVAIGKYQNLFADKHRGSVFIGAYAGPLSAGQNASYSVAIGNTAYVTTQHAIQLGKGTNGDTNTFKVGNQNGNFEMMDADGNVPLERLTYVTDQIGDISTALTAILGE